MKINLHNWKDLAPRDRKALFCRSGGNIFSVRDSVAQIIEEVKVRGDRALREFTLKFDQVDLGDLSLEVTDGEYGFCGRKP